MTLRKIIAGYDGGERSRDAVRFAAVLSQTTGAELILAHAYRYDPPFQSSSVDLRLALRAEAMEHLATAELSLPYGMRCALRVIEAHSPVHGLHDLAEAERADLIVLGATTKGALELHAVGSVAERLLHGAPCSVAVAPPGYADENDPGLHVIGVAVDGSPEAAHAIEAAVDLARRAGAALKLIGVAARPPTPIPGVATMYMPPEPAGAYRDGVLHQLEEVADRLPADLRTQVILADGDPADEIARRASSLSLLVMGSRGYGPIRRALLGSVSGPVLRAAPCPVLVVPRGTGQELSSPAAEASA